MITERWQDQARCLELGKDTEMFFSEDEERPSRERTTREELAKAVCTPCPVKQACLQAALDGDEVGVWGGTDTQQRRKMRRRGARRSCARCGGLQVSGTATAQICLECGATWLK